MAETHDPYAALRHRDYRLLLTGTVLAGLGSEVQATAVGWEVFEKTGRNDMIGYVGLVQVIPVLLFSLPAGQAADRYSRKALLAGALTLLVIASVGLAARSFFAESAIWLVYPFLGLAGIARAFSAPARWSLVPAVVPAEHLANAVTWNSSGWQVAFAAGPSLGGLAIAYLGGPPTAYLIAAVCAAVTAGLIIILRPQAPPRPVEGRSLASLLAGAKFIGRTKLILATITLDLFAVLFGGAIALLPSFSKDILGVGPVGFGWLRASPALGAIVTALVLAHRPPLRRAGRTLLWAVGGFGAATVVFGLSRDFFLSFAMLALTGALDNISVVVRGTLVQVLTPDAMRGRVSAVNAIFIESSNRLGDFESGMTAQWFGSLAPPNVRPEVFGPTASVVLGGVCTLFVVMGVALHWPQVLRLGALHRAGEAEPPVPDELPTDQPIR
ncbi:MAG TPA: MFS transporter [Gemmataceae bacterium]|nr:MFS transporter [Gemmataceae bacterium]